MNDSITINGQEINLDKKPSTGATDLFLLGRILYAENPSSKNYMRKIEIGKDDRFSLITRVQSAELWVNDSTRCIGELMTDMTYEEIDSHLKNLGYLIAGLAELEKLISDVRGMIPSQSKEEIS